jgi:tRNA 2-thiouridine synthesizing protein B
MSVLHLIFNSISDQDALNRCIELAQQDDEILLLENGVYCAQHPKGIQQLTNANVQTYVLSSDAQSRGIAIAAPFTAIDQTTFVQLTVKHQKSISWY